MTLFSPHTTAEYGVDEALNQLFSPHPTNHQREVIVFDFQSYPLMKFSCHHAMTE
jgi:hypothetical protein